MRSNTFIFILHTLIAPAPAGHVPHIALSLTSYRCRGVQTSDGTSQSNTGHTCGFACCSDGAVRTKENRALEQQVN